MTKIVKILNEKEYFLFVKTEDHASVYVASDVILGGKKELSKLLSEGNAFAEVTYNDKGYYAFVVGSKKALNRRGFGNPADVAAAKEEAAKKAAKKAAEEAARQAAWEKACKAIKEEREAREKETRKRKEFLLSKISETNKVFETIILDDPWVDDDGETQKNYVFNKENMIKIIEEFPNNLSWDERSQEFQIEQVWWDVQYLDGCPSVTDVATPINTVNRRFSPNAGERVK